MTRLLQLALYSLCLAGCASHDAEVQSLGEVPKSSSLDERRDLGRNSRSFGHERSAAVTLPVDAGQAVQIKNQRFTDGFRQKIELVQAGDNRNRGRIVILAGNTKATGTMNLITMEKPTEAGIKAELAANFTGFPMRVVDRPHYNAFGPYGLAVGRSPAGANCLYAWQWIEAAPRVGPDEMPVQASLRLRLCRFDLDFEQIADFVTRLDLKPDLPEGRGKKTPRASAKARARSFRLNSEKSQSQNRDRHRSLESRMAIRSFYPPEAGALPQGAPPTVASCQDADAGSQRPSGARQDPCQPVRHELDLTLPPEAYRGPQSVRPKVVPAAKPGAAATVPRT
jgi:Cellulose biosynthesis protein BcsN